MGDFKFRWNLVLNFCLKLGLFKTKEKRKLKVALKFCFKLILNPRPSAKTKVEKRL